MKKKMLCFAAMLFSIATAKAQSETMSSAAPPAGSYEAYSNLVRDNSYKMFGDSARAQKMHGRWEGFWGDRVDRSITGPGMFTAYSKALATGFIDQDPMACHGNGYDGNWAPLGPMRNYWGDRTDSAGRITALWVKPNDTNTILAGASGGGLWKTTNGGKNWNNITDIMADQLMPGTMGVTGIAVHPTDTSLIYITTGHSSTFEDIINGLPQTSMGLALSPDGGANWYPDIGYRYVTDTDSTDGWTNEFIRKIAYTASGRLIVMTGRHIYMKPTPTGAWADITPANLTSLPEQYFLTDFEMTRRPASGNKVVFVTSSGNNTQYLYYYNDGPGTWATRRTLSFDPGLTTVGYVFGMGLSKSDSVWLVIQSNAQHHLYKTGLTAGPLLQKNNGLHPVARDVYASDSVETLLYITNHQGWPDFIDKSSDNGLTYTSVGKTHSDGRVIVFYRSGTHPSGIDDVIFAGTDGGIAKKRKGSYGSESFVSLSGQGLNITQFNAHSSNPVNNSMLAAGAIDNGTQVWIRKRTQPWNIPLWGDGTVPALSRNGDTMAVGQNQNGLYLEALRYKPASSTVQKLSGSTQPPDNKSVYFNVSRRWLRPMKFDHNNVLRAGFHFIYKSTDIANTWTPAFDGTDLAMREPKPAVTMSPAPANLAMMGDFKKPVDFYISEQFPNVGYIAYQNTIANESDVTSINNGNLFRSIELTSSGSITWDKINPPQWHHRITDIEVDPAAPNRIWVSYGGINEWQIVIPSLNRQERVYYSSDYGDNWTDMSWGLPVMPVNKLAYVPGSDDVLFAATDIGVYRWNKTANIWECFNDGMPKCIVSSLEVLTCSGKLRAGTLGRGMWETPYNETYAVYPGDIYTINANITWNQSKTIEGSIRVKAGKTLTISGSGTTIYMPQLGRIHVEKGAKLVLDGARITNGCDSSRWSGIVLTGDKSLSPTATNQATFEMKNGAVIENAAVGVRDYNDATLQGGGRILASNSTFLNCWKAVSLNDYPNFDRSTTCTFTNVTFKINSNSVMEASNGTLPPHLFTAFNERGVKITGCTFTDERILDHGDKRSTALGVTDADFTVDNCDFLGMQRGVYADVVYVNPMAPKPTIVNSRFNNTRENITVFAHNPLVRSNSFTNLKPDLPGVGSAGLKKAAWAVYLEGTRGASIYGNTISGSPSTTLNTTLNRFKYGVIGKNAGSYWDGILQRSNVINNTINNVYSGVQSERINIGLIINCNSFSRNTYAMTLNPASGSSATFTPVIALHNGSCASSSSRPNNSFSGNANGIYSWITNVSNYLQYYVNSAGPGAYIPTGNWGGINIISCSGLGTTDGNLRCSRTPVITWNSSLLSSAVSSFTSAKAADPNSEDTWYHYGEVVRGYTQLDDLAGLKSFLLSDNTDASKIQLLPIYLNEGNYQTITSTINGMSGSSTEKSAFNSYFNILVALRQSNRNILQLTQNEQATMQSLANSETHIANAAKSLLEWGYDIAWNHIPEEPAQLRPGSEAEMTAGGEIANKSRLGDAAPNPVRNTTQIPVWVLPYDAANGCYLVIRDIMGKEMARYQLREGDNVVSVNTAAWATGLYAYSLLVDNQPADTKKFSKVQ